MAGRAGEHQFVAAVATGLAGAGLSPAGGQVELTLDGAAPVAITVATHGPGDVTAIAAAAIARLTPPPGSRTFEPNLFAAIELVHPALPWMLAPPRAPRLPWLALVVVEDREGVELAGTVLTLRAPASLARELPELDQAWAWVHAHGNGAAGDPIAPAAYAHAAEPTVARLVCPRRLDPATRYHAALVPVFEAGRRAGLSEPAGGGDALAWTTATALPLRLPVYRTWSFTTGDGGDFASLARALRARQLPLPAGRREVDAARPGWTLPDVDGRTVTVGGVLRPAKALPPPVSEAAAALGGAIATAIDAAAEPPAGEVPQLPLPVYGGHAIGAAAIAGGPPWLAQHNGDVRLRIAAGLGAEVVRRQQDELVDAAWRELGDAETANQLARQVELAAAVSGRLLARYVEPMSDDELVQVTRPSHRRLRLEDAPAGQPPRRTLAALIDESALPTAGISAAFRRIAGPGARAARAIGERAGAVLERANRAELAVVPRVRPPGGIAALDAISEAEAIQPRFSSAKPAAIDEAAGEWKAAPLRAGTIAMARRRETHIPGEETDWTPEPPSTLPDPDPVQIDEFAAAARRHQRYLVEHLGQAPLPPPRRPLAGGRLRTVRTRFRAAAAPAVSVVPPLAARLTGHAPTQLGELRPVAVTPTFERPLIHGLRSLGTHHVLPGIDAVPADTVALLTPDHDVVHAFLLGANHELAGELTWRGFPAPAGATPLRTFWGRVDVAGGQAVRLPDIPPVRHWPAAGPTPAPVNLVLLIRGALVERYPDAVVYLQPARWQGAHRVPGEGTPHPPLLQVALDAQTALYGFALDGATVEGAPHPGNPGWYVVIEEHPQAPRFGLAAGPERPLASWRDLTWTRVAPGDLAGTHLIVDGPLASLQPDQPAGLRWGADSAQLAAITLRRPTRIAIHASLLVRAVAPPPG